MLTTNARLKHKNNALIFFSFNDTLQTLKIHRVHEPFFFLLLLLFLLYLYVTKAEFSRERQK